MEINDAKYNHLLNDVLKGENVICENKTYDKVIINFNNPDNNISDDTVVYSVYRCKDEGCDLMHALTIIYPMTINGECNMTKGHYHANASMGEFYYCKKGHGLIMLQSRDGEFYIEEMKPGSVHLVPGKMAHRCINISETENLEFACVWSGEAGYDYEAIEKYPFNHRVYLIDGKVEIK